MNPCRNAWCPSKVDRQGQECGPCQRSAERTARLMARVEAKQKQREEAKA